MGIDLLLIFGSYVIAGIILLLNGHVSDIAKRQVKKFHIYNTKFILLQSTHTEPQGRRLQSAHTNTKTQGGCSPVNTHWSIEGFLQSFPHTWSVRGRLPTCTQTVAQRVNIEWHTCVSEVLQRTGLKTNIMH